MLEFIWCNTARATQGINELLKPPSVKVKFVFNITSNYVKMHKTKNFLGHRALRRDHIADGDDVNCFAPIDSNLNFPSSLSTSPISSSPSYVETILNNSANINPIESPLIPNSISHPFNVSNLRFAFDSLAPIRYDSLKLPSTPARFNSDPIHNTFSSSSSNLNYNRPTDHPSMSPLQAILPEFTSAHPLPSAIFNDRKVFISFHQILSICKSLHFLIPTFV